ncbi:MAG: ABC transporter substrate-binding protein [Oscillospiraceae bacterium]
MKKRILAFLMAAVMTLALVACGSGSGQTDEGGDAPQETTRDTFTMAISYMPNTLVPQGASDDYTTMTRPLYDRLLVENNEGGIDYYLADSLEISEDGLTYTIHIRDNANWSDGTPITSADFKFVCDYYTAKYGYNPYCRVNGVEGSVNYPDDKTIEVVLPEPYSYYIVTLSGIQLMPAHEFESPEALIDDQSYYTTTDIVTSGAYTVKEINEDSLVFEARDDYYRGTPEVKYIVMKVIGSGSTKAIAFENGEIDYMRITTVDELEKYSAQTDKYNIYTVSEARLNYLQVNPYGPANLTDAQREALFYAIDGDEVIQGAYGSTDLATNPNSLLTPDQSLYNANTPDYVYDLEKAKELAESSGLAGMTLTYIYNADRANMEAVAVVLQQQLQQIGVTLDIQGLDSNTFFTTFFGVSYGTGLETTWDLGTNGWDSMRGSTLNQAYSYMNNAANAWGLTPVCGELAAKVNSTTDPAEAQQLADEVVELALKQYRIYPLTYTNYVMVSQKHVTGLDCSGIVPEFIDWLGISVNG